MFAVVSWGLLRAYLYSALWSRNDILTRENVMESGGYYVATHVLTVWKRLAGLAPDQPHGWNFPDVIYLS